mgnify:FL=1
MTAPCLDCVAAADNVDSCRPHARLLLSDADLRKGFDVDVNHGQARV